MELAFRLLKEYLSRSRLLEESAGTASGADLGRAYCSVKEDLPQGREAGILKLKNISPHSLRREKCKSAHISMKWS
jgi:hypothetical protein